MHVVSDKVNGVAFVLAVLAHMAEWIIKTFLFMFAWNYAAQHFGFTQIDPWVAFSILVPLRIIGGFFRE